MSLIPAIAPNTGAAPETMLQAPEAQPFAVVAAQAMERNAAAAAAEPDQGSRDPDSRKLPPDGQVLPAATGQSPATDWLAATGIGAMISLRPNGEPPAARTGTESATESLLAIDDGGDATAATASWLARDWRGLIESSAGRESGAVVGSGSPQTVPDPSTRSPALLAIANPQPGSLLNSMAVGAPGNKDIADTPNADDASPEVLSIHQAGAASPLGDTSRLDPFSNAWAELFGGAPAAESSTGTPGAGGSRLAFDTATAPLPADLMGRVATSPDASVPADPQYALAGTTPTGGVVNGTPLSATSGAGIEHLMRLPQPLADPQWPAQFATRVEWLIGNGAGDARIQINPPELGPIDIRIAMHDDQARIHFTVHHAAVRDAVEESLPRLREMLQQSGLQLANADVSAERQGQPRHDPMFDVPYLPSTDRYSVASTESVFTGFGFLGTGLVDTFV